MEEISLEDLFRAWDEFKIGKRGKRDVGNFERNLEDNLFGLYEMLRANTYRHGSYSGFNIYDPKFRIIHKATVGDRIVHHAIFSIIEPLFDKIFIFDSYSCRRNKGTHRAVKKLAVFIRKVSKNYRGKCYCLKLDIKQFFASVDHQILLAALGKRVKSEPLLTLLKNIIGSFSRERGIPIGNLTSQIFANIYLNKLDQFVKHELKARYYLRYCDDFVIVSDDKNYLEDLILEINDFLQTQLKLSLHENKRTIRKYTQGIDFLGYIILPHIIVPRNKTKRRIFRKLRMKSEEFGNGRITGYSLNQSVQSHLGFLKHANAYRLSQELKNQAWLFGGLLSSS